MAEAIRGSLTQLRLIDILKLLTTHGKTGRLIIKRGDEAGEIYFDQGKIVHSTLGMKQGETTFLALLSWGEGEFEFTPNVATPENSITMPTDRLLMEGIKRIQEWERIKKLVPSEDTVFKLSTRQAAGQISLQPQDWNILSRVDGKKNVKEILRETGINEMQALRILYRLYSAGLLEVSKDVKKEKIEILDKKFFELLEEELKKVMGPIADIIISDAIEELGETRENFPFQKASKLVEKVSMEISDEEKRLSFQKAMLDILKKL